MTDHDSPAERSVRGMLAERADEIRPPADLADTILTRHRRDRSRTLAVIAVTAVVALITAGVPAALHRLGTGAVKRPAQQAPALNCTPAKPDRTGLAVDPAGLPTQTRARGSLGGDAELVRRVLVAGWTGLLRGQTYPAGLAGGARPDLAPGTAKVQLVERLGDGFIGLVVATDLQGTGYYPQWVTGVGETINIANGDDQGRFAGPYRGNVGDPARDQRVGQLFYGDNPVSLSVHETRCGTVLVVLAPPGAQARMATRGDIDANGAIVRDYQPIPLTDGIAVVPVPVGDNRGVAAQVLSAGWPVADWSAGLAYPSNGANPTAQPTAAQRADAAWPTTGQVDQALRTARGQVDPTTAAQALHTIPSTLLGLPRNKPEVIWGGRLLDGTPVLLVANQFASGARYLTSYAPRPVPTETLSGILPAGPLDRSVFAWVAGADDELVVVAPGAVRAEVDLKGGNTRQIPFTDGGGVLKVHGSQPIMIRAYDAQGRLVGARPPRTGLIPLPSTL
jgi:hypothetical protein